MTPTKKGRNKFRKNVAKPLRICPKKVRLKSEGDKK